MDKLGDDMPVKNRLREIRHQMMVDKQIEMAELLGVDLKQYNRYERNVVQPSIHVAFRIASALGKKVDEIFYEVD
jgi:DNA-binding XRE family transcriptional regulator